MVRSNKVINEMSELESIIIGSVVGITCPLLTFVAFWWTAALLHLYVSIIPLSAVITAALVGLGFGFLLDAIFLRKWVGRFYLVNVWLMAVVYLSLCVVAVAFFMGLPVGTLVLGIFAGAYIGRREHHRQVNSPQVARSLRRVSLLAALVTAAMALPIGILALNEQHIIALLETNFGLDKTIFQGSTGLKLIGFLCFLLFAIQYWCSKGAGYLAFRMGKNAQ